MEMASVILEVCDLVCDGGGCVVCGLCLLSPQPHRNHERLIRCRLEDPVPCCYSMKGIQTSAELIERQLCWLCYVMNATKAGQRLSLNVTQTSSVSAS